MVTHRSEFNRFPLFMLAAACAAGILCANLFALPLSLALVCGICASVFSCATFFRHRHGAASLFIVLAFVCAGAILSIEERQGLRENSVRRFYEDGRIASGEPVELTGVLASAPETAPDGQYIAVRVESLRFKTLERTAQGTVELFASLDDAAAREEYQSLELRRGARVRVLVALTRSDNFRNPGVSTLTEFLERGGWDAKGNIKSPLLMERLDDERVWLPLVWLDAWRAWLIGNANRFFSIETAGVLNASMLGNRRGLTRATSERFRAGGTFHVLVISGLHVTFVGGLVWGLARRLTRRRAWAWASSALCVWLYAIAVGAESSVVRAALMFTIVAFAPIVARRANTLNALGGAALALLVWRPANLFDPSFQLTFLSVLSITTLVWPLFIKLRETGEWQPTQETPYPPVCPRWWRSLAEMLFWSERHWRREMARATHSYTLFKTPLAARLERWRLQKPLRYVFAAVLVSVGVQAGMLPVFVLYFHRLSLASLLLNICVGILMVVLSFAALAAMLLAQVSESLSAPFVWLAEHVNSLMTHSVDPFAAMHVASLRLPEYAGAAGVIYGLYFAPLLILAVALARWSPIKSRHETFGETANTKSLRIVRCAVVVHFILLLIIITHPLSAGLPSGRLRIDFLDVGQGDAALLTMPDGTTLLVDAGGRPNFNLRAQADAGEDVEPFERDSRSIGEAVVSEYLWWRGLDRVDFILATHADADHIDGLNDVVRNFRVAAALVARAPAADIEFARFAQTANDEGLPIYLVRRGDTLQLGEVLIDVIWPPRVAVNSDASSGNDNSIVLRLRFGQKTFLLTGDIEARAESNLLVAHEDLRCDVLKVAHHGSKTSSTAAFVGATRPALAIISVGESSPFGHPHAEVLERWRTAGAQTLTTGQSGTITVSTDGEDLRVETFK